MLQAEAEACSDLIALLRIPLLLWIALLEASLVRASIIARLASEVALWPIPLLIAMMMIMMKEPAEKDAVCFWVFSTASWPAANDSAAEKRGLTLLTDHRPQDHETYCLPRVARERL